MKNREHFLREDLSNFKRKFKSVCRENQFQSSSLIKKYSDLVAQVNRKHYICIVENEVNIK